MSMEACLTIDEGAWALTEGRTQLRPWLRPWVDLWAQYLHPQDLKTLLVEELGAYLLERDQVLARAEDEVTRPGAR